MTAKPSRGVLGSSRRTLRYQVRQRSSSGAPGSFLERAPDRWTVLVSQHNDIAQARKRIEGLMPGDRIEAYVFDTRCNVVLS